MLNFNHKLCKFTQGKCSLWYRLFVLSHYYVACSLHLSGLATHISHYIKLTLFPLTIFYTKIDGPFGSFSFIRSHSIHAICSLSHFLSVSVCLAFTVSLDRSSLIILWYIKNQRIRFRFSFLHSTIKFLNNTNKTEWSFVYIYTFKHFSHVKQRTIIDDKLQNNIQYTLLFFSFRGANLNEHPLSIYTNHLNFTMADLNFL